MDNIVHVGVLYYPWLIVIDFGVTLIFKSSSCLSPKGPSHT